MKCPNCNAETNEHVCPYCGSEIPQLKKSNKGRCPKCGSEDISFKREATRRNSKSTSYRITKNVRTRGGSSSASYRTIGLCQNCGYSWVPNSGSGTGGHPWWWVFAICFWPISLSILFWKSDKFKLSRKTKGIALGVIWGVFLLITIISGVTTDSSSNTEASNAIETTAETNEITREAPVPMVEQTEESMPEPTAEPTPEPTPEPTLEPMVEENAEMTAEVQEAMELPLAEEQSVTTAYATDVVKIREQPNTDCNVLGKTQPGDKVTVFGEEGDWSRVNCKGIDGYIKSEYLSYSVPSQTQEVVAASEPVQNVIADTAAVVVPSVPDPVVSNSVVAPSTSTGGSEWQNAQLNADGIVYKTPTGSCYHYDPDCAGPNATPISLNEAMQHYRPCKTCVLR